jgi:hypothetical protein
MMAFSGVRSSWLMLARCSPMSRMVTTVPSAEPLMTMGSVEYSTGIGEPCLRQATSFSTWAPAPVSMHL